LTDGHVLTVGTGARQGHAVAAAFAHDFDSGVTDRAFDAALSGGFDSESTGLVSFQRTGQGSARILFGGNGITGHDSNTFDQAVVSRFADSVHVSADFTADARD